MPGTRALYVGVEPPAPSAPRCRPLTRALRAGSHGRSWLTAASSTPNSSHVAATVGDTASLCAILVLAYTRDEVQGPWHGLCRHDTLTVRPLRTGDHLALLGRWFGCRGAKDLDAALDRVRRSRLAGTGGIPPSVLLQLGGSRVFSWENRGRPGPSGATFSLGCQEPWLTGWSSRFRLWMSGENACDGYIERVARTAQSPLSDETLALLTRWNRLPMDRVRGSACVHLPKPVRCGCGCRHSQHRQGFYANGFPSGLTNSARTTTRSSTYCWPARKRSRTRSSTHTSHAFA